MPIKFSLTCADGSKVDKPGDPRMPAAVGMVWAERCAYVGMQSSLSGWWVGAEGCSQCGRLSPCEFCHSSFLTVEWALRPPLHA